MKLKLKKKMSSRVSARLTKKVRIRKTVNGTDERPRLCVFRSGKHIYAQIVNDVIGKTLMTASSLTVDQKKSGKDMAKFVGSKIAEMAKSKNISNVVFDRNGYLYHGRIQALAEGAREAGLNF